MKKQKITQFLPISLLLIFMQAYSMVNANNCADVTISTSPNTIQIAIVDNTVNYIKVFDSNWTEVGFICNSWGGVSCTGNPSMAVAAGAYNVEVNYTGGTSCYVNNLQVPSSQSCFPAGITFTTQQEIDDFMINYPGCTIIGGDVVITGLDITNLLGLSAISSIEGKLQIEDVFQLSNLEGLNNLSFIGENLGIVSTSIEDISALNNLTSGNRNLSIMNNPNLASLAGLENVTTVTAKVFISGNPSLSDLTGLGQLAFIGDFLVISSNSGLTSLNGLTSLTTIVGGLNVTNNDALFNLAGLENLTSIGSVFAITQNDALINLSGVNNLTTIGGAFRVGSNELLENFSGLENLNSVGLEFEVTFCPMLTDINALSQLESIGGRLFFQSNTSLTSLSGLDNIDPSSITDLRLTLSEGALVYCNVQSICDYLENGGTAAIYDNGQGCNSVSEVNAACSANCPVGNIILSTQSEVDNFAAIYPGCTNIQGDLSITGSEITNLNGLEHLSSIAGSFDISYNTPIVEITGLNNLTTVGAFRIAGNQTLTAISGLNNLTHIDGNLHLIYGALMTISGFNNLSTVGGDFWLASNFTSLLGLNQLNTVVGDFRIEGTSLTDLAGLENVTSLGSLTVFAASNLQSLSGLDNLSQLSRLYLDATPLSDISALSGVQSALTALTIRATGLSNCAIQSICVYLENGGVATIDNSNVPGCNNPEEVLAACTTCATFEVCDIDFSFCNGTLSANIPGSVNVSYIKVFDSNWSEVGFMCNSWAANACGSMEEIYLGAGTFYVEVNYGALGSCYMETTYSLTTPASYSNIQGRIKTDLNEESSQLSIVSNTIPDPSLILNYLAAEEGVALIEIYDISGRRVYTNKMEMTEGENNIRLDLPHLNAGHYFLHCTQKGMKTTTRFVKMKL